MSFSLVSGTLGGGESYRLLVPDSGMITGKAIAYCHGYGEDGTDVLGTDKFDCTSALVGAGYLIAESADNGNSWGNSASLATKRELITLLRDDYGLLNLGLWGQSAGGILSLLLASSLGVSGVRVKGFLGTFPACDLDDMHGGALSASIDTAYGGNYAVNSVGHNPIARAASSFTGIGMRFYASPDDTVVAKTANSDAMATHLGIYPAEKEVVLCSGEHGDASHFQPSDYLASFQRFFALPDISGIISATSATFGTLNIG
jgi:hypothetical protein